MCTTPVVFSTQGIGNPLIRGDSFPLEWPGEIFGFLGTGRTCVSVTESLSLRRRFLEGAGRLVSASVNDCQVAVESGGQRALSCDLTPGPADLGEVHDRSAQLGMSPHWGQRNDTGTPPGP